MNGEEHHNEDPNQDQRVMALLFHGTVEPINKVLHPSRRFKRGRRLEDNSQTLTVRADGLDMVRDGLILATMVLILGAIFEENTVELLDVILGRSNRIVPFENHIHRIGVARDFLLVAAGK